MISRYDEKAALKVLRHYRSESHDVDLKVAIDLALDWYYAAKFFKQQSADLLAENQKIHYRKEHKCPSCQPKPSDP